MNSPGPSQRLVDEIIDDLEKKYKSPTPESIALKAVVFEGLLHRYVLLLAGLNTCAIGWEVLYRLGALTQLSAAGGALSASGVCAFLAWRWRGEDKLPRTLITGTSLAFLLLAASVWGELTALSLIISLAAVVVALAATNRLPEGAAAMFALYLPIVMAFDGGGRFATEHPYDQIVSMALIFVPMIGIFIWRHLKLGASCALTGAVLTGASQLTDASDTAALTSLCALLVVGGLVYEVRIRWTHDSLPREFVRLGMLVALVYLLVGAIAAWFKLDKNALWLAAFLICAYEIPSGLRDGASLPYRFVWACLSVTVGLLASDDWQWTSRTLSLLTLCALMQLAGLRVRSRFLSNAAVLYAVGVAAWCLFVGARGYDRDVLIVGMLTFVGLLLLSTRPVFESAAPALHVQSGPISLLKRGLLIAGGALLRVPFVGWVFFLVRTGFQWLRYFRSSSEPLSFSDLLFAGAHVYGVVLLMRQVEFFLGQRGFALNDQLLVSAFFAAGWGATLLAYGVWKEDIYCRMIGVTLIIAPTVMQSVAQIRDNRYYAWIAVGIGLAAWLSSWCVLRYRTDVDPPAIAPPSTGSDGEDDSG